MAWAMQNGSPIWAVKVIKTGQQRFKKYVEGNSSQAPTAKDCLFMGLTSYASMFSHPRVMQLLDVQGVQLVYSRH